MDQLAHIYHMINWEAVGAAVAGGATSSPLALVLTKWLRAQKGWVKMTLSIATALIVALAGAVLSSSDPRLVPLHTVFVAFSATPIYLFVLKPLLGEWAKAVDDADDQKIKDLKSSIIPPEGLPISNSMAGGPTATPSSNVGDSNWGNDFSR